MERLMSHKESEHAINNVRRGDDEAFLSLKAEKFPDNKLELG